MPRPSRLLKSSGWLPVAAPSTAHNSSASKSRIGLSASDDQFFGGEISFAIKTSPCLLPTRRLSSDPGMLQTSSSPSIPCFAMPAKLPESVAVAAPSDAETAVAAKDNAATANAALFVDRVKKEYAFSARKALSNLRLRLGCETATSIGCLSRLERACGATSLVVEPRTRVFAEAQRANPRSMKPVAACFRGCGFINGGMAVMPCVRRVIGGVS